MTVDEGPTLRRRRLGTELRTCRERAGMTQDAVSRHFEWHTAKVTRIETAKVAVTPRDVRDLLTLYRVTDIEYRESLVQLARASRQRSWWTHYRDIMRPGAFIGMEAEALSCRVWEPVVIPGLLQTEAYMRALMRPGLRTDAPDNITRRVALRLMRQERLVGDKPLNLWAVLDESVLRRVVGGREVMREQLERLVSVAQRPHVTLLVLPFAAGEHAFMGGSVAMLEFPEAAHLDMVYLEGLSGDQYEEEPDEVERYRGEFDRLGELALNQDASINMIKGMIDG